jgi:AcrR family transcriptional regulator
VSGRTPQSSPDPTVGDLLRRPMRADARRNYERLIAAAGELFAAYGPDASLDEIARRAEVGNATLYRHFPTREALIVAVCADDVETLCRLGERLADQAGPDVAIVGWLRAFVDHVTARNGLAAALMAAGRDGQAAVAACQTALEAAGSRLLDAAQERGTFRPDVTIADLLRIVTAVAMTATSADEAQRLLGVVLLGVQTS